jgi:hypothetical protein
LPPPPDNSSRPESSSRPQNPKALPSFGTIMPITGGSAMEFETKKQRNNYFRSVNTIINDGPAAWPKWAKVPITFTKEDFKLKSTNHNDAIKVAKGEPLGAPPNLLSSIICTTSSKFSWSSTNNW